LGQWLSISLAPPVQPIIIDRSGCDKDDIREFAEEWHKMTLDGHTVIISFCVIYQRFCIEFGEQLPRYCPDFIYVWSGLGFGCGNSPAIKSRCHSNASTVAAMTLSVPMPLR
jgi:hypothetical protein